MLCTYAWESRLAYPESGIQQVACFGHSIECGEQRITENPAGQREDAALYISLVTPAAKGSRAGNRATAERWAGLLRKAGHRVRVSLEADDEADLLLALHAWRSHGAVRRFRQRHPDRPIVLALTGTDIYRFQHSEPQTTLETMAMADALIGLHERVKDDIPDYLHERYHTVYQSAEALPGRRDPLKRHFEVLVIGHLREEKDALRAAWAVRSLPESSRIRVLQLGRAHDGTWQARAEEEMAHNGRYRWQGEVPRWQVRQLMARARVMVMSSIMEGGANVVSEACVAGLPVIASDIPGNVGLLGADYPGYYPVGDTGALRERLLRAEQDPDYLATLRHHCESRAPLFHPDAEQASLVKVINAAREQYGEAGSA